MSGFAGFREARLSGARPEAASFARIGEDGPTPSIAEARRSPAAGDPAVRWRSWRPDLRAVTAYRGDFPAEEATAALGDFLGEA